MSEKRKGNRLVTSSSPYLLQHANNPVNWQPWDSQSLQQAIDEDKPILISIGYSACHWCHVMEHQSFENREIAEIMNTHFVCIKVDREERPDLDQIYMDAIQAMGLPGGWPLNVFLTPQQKPFYGGTYFPPSGWQQLLDNVAEAFRDKRDQLEESANGFTENLNISETEKYGIGHDQIEFTTGLIDEMVIALEKKFDYLWGGLDKEPKFPMPAIWDFLLNTYQLLSHKKAGEMTFITLEKIATGGIYDHIGGGFARYSTDKVWHIPHFEKMLYDNGQLLSLYAKAYHLKPEKWIKKIILQTIDWLTREMTDSNGGFYSALDADSEGEEGKFYCWSYAEFKTIAGEDEELLATYYDVKKEGNWEAGKNNYRLLFSHKQIADQFKLSEEALQSIITDFEKKSLTLRSKRIRPGLDHKILTAWNGLMLKGLVDSYRVLPKPYLKQLIIRNGQFILKNLKKGDRLIRSHEKSNGLDDAEPLSGFLEDYVWTIDAFLALYQITLDFKWLNESKKLAKYVLNHFYDPKEKLFYYTDHQSTTLIARKKEVFDNVIPSSNAGMAFNLFRLGHIFNNKNYQKIAFEMVSGMTSLTRNEPEFLSYWGSTLLAMNTPIVEVVVAGTVNEEIIEKLFQKTGSHTFLLRSSPEEEIEIPLVKGKSAIDGKTTFYVCVNKTCQLPVTDVSKVLIQFN